ncbi:hypothetical protein DL98DRAFT_522449 [Cadophora sp. DSE1049]|nr:hypothetical protein DL98DRAFT_522449 [Cadophora sp. DSE1049]
MGVMYVRKNGSVEDVAAGWDNFAKEFKGSTSGEDSERLGALEREPEGQARRNGFGGAMKAYGIVK